MLVLNAGARVTQLRFLPDGRLLVGTWAAGDATLAIWPLTDGPVVFIPLPHRQVWDEPNRLAVHPSGDRLITAFGGLAIVSIADGLELPDGPTGPANQVILSPDGGRLIFGYRDANGKTVTHGISKTGERVVDATDPPPDYLNLVGFFPDGDRIVLVGDHSVVVRSLAHPGEEHSVRYPSHHVNHPQLSPDGRHLGVTGYGKMYVYNTTALGKPRAIDRAWGFAFHPAGKTLAVTSGTLLKLYDLDMLKLRTKLHWKVGPLTCVAFSADGLLGAVGTDDGRVVVWDADE